MKRLAQEVEGRDALLSKIDRSGQCAIDHRTCLDLKFQWRLLCVSQDGACGEMAAHPMHTSARRCGRRTDVESFDRRRVEPERGPQKELTQVLSPPVDVAAYQIGVASFEFGRRHDSAREHTVAESGRESLDLIFNPFRY